MPPHIHATAIALVTFAAFWIVFHMTVQGVASHHHENPFWRAAALAA